MQAEYPALYCDAHGEERTTILNDGKSLQMTLRGVTFIGHMFDDFEPTVPLNDSSLAAFTLNRYGEDRAELCDCEITFEMRLPVVTSSGAVEASLRVRAVLGKPTERGGIDREEFPLTLLLDGAEYRSTGRSGWFEDELIDIQRQLPEGTYMRACINCAYSDYSVYGHGAFECMMCFRNNKSAYSQVKDKDEYMQIMDTYTELVQETYLCPEFERRPPGTGYRG